jgi:hypothetical protein
VKRRPERADRRAKLVVPTERRLEVTRLSGEIIRDIERRQAAALAEGTYDDFRQTLRAVVDSLVRPPDNRDRSLSRVSLPGGANP